MVLPEIEDTYRLSRMFLSSVLAFRPTSVVTFRPDHGIASGTQACGFSGASAALGESSAPYSAPIGAISDQA